MEKGVLILALGHPYYGNYANQLARSIKAVCPEAVVAVAHDGVGISHVAHKHQFDQLIEIPREYYMTGDLPDYLKAKTFLYELTPFERTLYVDADTIWLPQKSVMDVFNEFQTVKFTMSNRGRETLKDAKSGFIHWMDPAVMMKEYGLDPEAPLYNAASEFIYFEKCAQVKWLFEEAEKVYAYPPSDYKRFAHGIPDELAFEIAMIKCKLYPHAAPYTPFYWEQFERKSLSPHQIYPNYYGFSLGGNTLTDGMRNIYNGLANHYNKKFGVNGYFPAKDKRSFLPQRSGI